MQYRPDIRHRMADGVSKLLTDGENDTPLSDAVPCFAVEASDRAPPDELLALGWRKEYDDRSEKRAWMPEFLAVKETEVLPTMVEEFLQKQAEDPFGK